MMPRARIEGPLHRRMWAHRWVALDFAAAVLVCLALITGVSLVSVACATAHRAGDAAKPALIDCAKQNASGIVALLAAFGVRSAIEGRLDVDALETIAKGQAAGVAACAFAEFVRAWKAKPTPQVAARGGDDDPVVELQALLERVSGGAKVVLADGTAM